MAVDRLSLTFGALADPTRRAILARLAKGGASVTELAAPFEMSLPAVSKHLKVLERAGLVARGREAQWRPAGRRRCVALQRRRRARDRAAFAARLRDPLRRRGPPARRAAGRHWALRHLGSGDRQQRDVQR